jgi:hypothetical protein
MDTINMFLKTRLSEILQTLNLIIILYAIFLTILGIIIHNSETIIQVCIMFVVYIIFEYINYDLTQISKKGIKCQKYGFIDWKDIYRVKRKQRDIYIYTKKQEKPYKIIVKKTEDKLEIERAYKYILSKVKMPEKMKPKQLDEIK